MFGEHAKEEGSWENFFYNEQVFGVKKISQERLDKNCVFHMHFKWDRLGRFL
jgi:hypothetical protein